MNLELPFPAKILWPNGRGHHMAKHRAFQKHKQWAYSAVCAAGGRRMAENTSDLIQWSATFYPKTRNKIDRDNAAASLKAFQDGIALAMGTGDDMFDTPTIHFAEPVKNGSVVIVIGEG